MTARADRDGGVFTPPYLLRQPLVSKGGAIFVPGRSGTLLRSDDGGLNWRLLPTNTSGHLKGLFELPDGSGLLAYGDRIVLIRPD